MQTTLHPNLAKTETVDSWLNPANLINDSMLPDPLLTTNLANTRSHIKAHDFYRDGFSMLPDGAEIVGIELYVRHKATPKKKTTLIDVSEQTYTIQSNSSAWVYAGDFGPNEYVEVAVTGEAVWSTGQHAYPEGSYSSYPHAEAPCSVSTLTVFGTHKSVNVPPHCIVMCCRTAGTNVADVGNDIIDGYRVGRHSVIDPSKLGVASPDNTHSGQSGWQQGVWYNKYYNEFRFTKLNTGSLFFCFNDELTQYADNTGSFTVTVKRYKSEIPVQAVYLACTNIDKHHFPNLQSINYDTTISEFTIDVNSNKWYDTGITIQPGEHLSFVVENIDNPTKRNQTNTGNVYVYPEGYYGDSPQTPNHIYDYDNCSSSGWTSFPTYFAASNVRPFSVTATLVDVNTNNGSKWKNLGLHNNSQFAATISDGMQLNRYSAFASSELPNYGAGRLVLIFNDKAGNSFSGLGQYANSAGQIRVKVIRGESDHQRMDVGLTVRDGYDIDTHWKSFTNLHSLSITKLGNVNDLWGKSSWSANEVNNLTGIVFRRSIIAGESIDDDRQIDFCWLVVHWNEPGGLFEVSERESVKQQIHYGKEVTKGTAVSPTHRAMDWKCNPSPDLDLQGWRPQGSKTEEVQMLMSEHSKSSISGIPTYVGMGALLASAIGKPVSSGGVADERNIHVFSFDAINEQDIQTYTIEYGDAASRAHKIAYAFCDSFGLNFTGKSAELSGSMLGRPLVDGITFAGGNSAVQSVVISGSPTGGTFVLAFKGAPTSALAYNISTSDLATALNALSTIGSGGVAVTGSAGNYVITFSGASLTKKQLPELELFTNGLTGGTTPTVTIETTTAGGYTELPIIPILPGHCKVYIANDYASLSSGKLTRARMTKFDLANRADPFWVMDSDNGAGFAGHVETPVNFKFGLQVQANSTGMGLLADARLGTGKFVRFEAIGPEIGSSGFYHKFKLDMYAKVSSVGDLSDQDGVYQSNYEFTMANGAEAGWTNSLIATLENGIVSY